MPDGRDFPPWRRWSVEPGRERLLKTAHVPVSRFSLFRSRPPRIVPMARLAKPAAVLFDWSNQLPLDDGRFPTAWRIRSASEGLIPAVSIALSSAFRSLSFGYAFCKYLIIPARYSSISLRAC